jgi:AAA family ATP:ADP antiporter
MLKVLMKICSFNFGKFEREEFKKFLYMGCIFAVMIGVYWTLRLLKDALFIQLVDKTALPYAKTVSVLALLPLVIFYTKLLERTSRERMLVILPTFYGVAVLLFSIFMAMAQGTATEIASRSLPLLIATKVLAYLWYFFVESFGSLAVALFWAFATDTTEPLSAKRGFPLVVAIGQIGGIICPYVVGKLPHRLGLTTDTISIVILGCLTLAIVPMVRNFLKITPSNLLAAFSGSNQNKEQKQHGAGFFEGLKLLISNKYLIAIFSVNFIYEFIITVFDYNFKIAASTAFNGVALTNYLSSYASSVNVVSLLCLLLGISNVTRFLGIGVALAAMPIILGLALLGFMSFDSLSFLFTLMVGSKAINYALNGPALKQLYIPTTSDVRFKAQAWIETFGARASKEAASIFNMSLKPLQNSFGELIGRAHYLSLSGFIGFPLVLLWFVVAIYLGKTFRDAIKEQKVVC